MVKRELVMEMNLNVRDEDVEREEDDSPIFVMIEEMKHRTPIEFHDRDEFERVMRSMAVEL